MKRAAPRRRGSGAPARPRATRAQQRQHLIDACISALHLHGPSHTTVQKVTAIARMSPGIVRFYFDSKAAMMVASLEFLAAEFEQLLLVPVGALRATPVAALERLVELYLGAEIASARKVSVWYSFWGEASSRQEYYDICGKKDDSFAALVRELIQRLIEDSGARHLDADGVALGLIGVLEMLWQDYAFQTESTINRAGAARRAMAYLRSVFPGRFGASAAPAPRATPPGAAYRSAARLAAEREALFAPAWQFVAVAGELAREGDFVTLDSAVGRLLVLRDGAGALHAFGNSCPQRPHALLEARRGRLSGPLACVSHGLRFDATGRSVDGATALPVFELAGRGAALFVRAAAGAEPGAAPFAAAATLRPMARPLATDADADWKVLVEHWLEAGVEAVDPAAGDDGWSARRYRAVAGAAGPWLRQFVGPNQLFETHAAGLLAWQVLPLGAGRARLRCLGYRHEHGPRHERLLAYLALRLARRRARRERALGESVQRGLESPAYAAAPRLAPPAALAAFRHTIARLLPGAD